MSTSEAARIGKIHDVQYDEFGRVQGAVIIDIENHKERFAITRQALASITSSMDWRFSGTNEHIVFTRPFCPSKDLVVFSSFEAADKERKKQNKESKKERKKERKKEIKKSQALKIETTNQLLQLTKQTANLAIDTSAAKNSGRSGKENNNNKNSGGTHNSLSNNNASSSTPTGNNNSGNDNLTIDTSAVKNHGRTGKENSNKNLPSNNSANSSTPTGNNNSRYDCLTIDTSAVKNHGRTGKENSNKNLPSNNSANSSTPTGNNNSRYDCLTIDTSAANFQGGSGLENNNTNSRAIKLLSNNSTSSSEPTWNNNSRYDSLTIDTSAAKNQGRSGLENNNTNSRAIKLLGNNSANSSKPTWNNNSSYDNSRLANIFIESTLNVQVINEAFNSSNMRRCLPRLREALGSNANLQVDTTRRVFVLQGGEPTSMKGLYALLEKNHLPGWIDWISGEEGWALKVANENKFVTYHRQLHEFYNRAIRAVMNQHKNKTNVRLKVEWLYYKCDGIRVEDGAPQRTTTKLLWTKVPQRGNLQDAISEIRHFLETLRFICRNKRQKWDAIPWLQQQIPRHHQPRLRQLNKYVTQLLRSGETGPDAPVHWAAHSPLNHYPRCTVTDDNMAEVVIVLANILRLLFLEEDATTLENLGDVDAFLEQSDSLTS